MTHAPVPAVTVRPGRPLSGTVRVDGSKNAALPLLAAAATIRRPVRMGNVPDSADVQLLLALLQRSGRQLARPSAVPRSVALLPLESHPAVPELPDAGRIRASYYLVPALLAACGQARLPWPGGCRIGDRGMDEHFKVYAAFGDKVETDQAGYRVTASPSSPAQVTVDLPFRSRGASVAAVLRAVAGGHRLRLGNPNLSPEFTGVLDFLRQAGWQADLARDVLRVEPPAAPDETATLDWSVPGDKIEAGTLACAIAATGGSGRIEGVRAPDVRPVAEALNQLGIPVRAEPDALVLPGGGTPTGAPLTAVASLDPDGLDADFEPALLALALGLPGTHLFADAINPGRHGNLLPQLRLLGAEFEELSATRCRLTGPQRLTGTVVEAIDIRTGSALLIAGLTARGTTTVTGLDQLRRGHADLPAKLRALGADVTEAAR
ncbi:MULTISPECIES: UDP-N-acetylglucosamine 1-carboxyvinyltransferase [Kitasatospora]|uniref:UDP-N-acetylglucosamine 1-carboxyvinyltransferase n=1 Tax=Kitasatospora setae (strain ATCC 33774 / DSM 43861 / JCM 3304 / KCC A-0304 / NBRC 14216 / KM-6054) TaxID=452652 RepID=E4NCZ6_KITSK|nr:MULTISPECIES: UDP-N-acetylglucosamine 1-carboxyvinyltransferase [Kitasatospora]BAJ29077.1 putative UDP-N-acetylglucosamine 1-carboxyvinyltransferase [Kitasatospora setae KM-6054]